MAVTKTLSEFKSRLLGGGARPNLFQVDIPAFPSSISDAWGSGEQAQNGTFNFMCKAAQLPASNIAAVPIPFRGRTLKVAGDRTFDPWIVTIINDEDFSLRTAFEEWMNVISKLDDATGVSNPSSYMCDAYVQQFGRGKDLNSTTNEGGQSAVLRTYKFYDMVPTTISAIDLNYDSTDTIEQFDVTFEYQYYTVGNSLTSSGGNTDEVLIE